MITTATTKKKAVSGSGPTSDLQLPSSYEFTLSVRSGSEIFRILWEFLK